MDDGGVEGEMDGCVWKGGVVEGGRMGLVVCFGGFGLLALEG